MIHRITYADGSFTQWYDPRRAQARPCEIAEPDFYAATLATATVISAETDGWGALRRYESHSNISDFSTNTARTR